MGKEFGSAVRRSRNQTCLVRAGLALPKGTPRGAPTEGAKCLLKKQQITVLHYRDHGERYILTRLVGITIPKFVEPQFLSASVLRDLCASVVNPSWVAAPRRCYTCLFYVRHPEFKIHLSSITLHNPLPPLRIFPSNRHYRGSTPGRPGGGFSCKTTSLSWPKALFFAGAVLFLRRLGRNN